MEEIKITGNHKMVRIYYAIYGICGALIIGDLIYSYLAGEMMDKWLLYVSVGLYMSIYGVGYSSGLIKLNIPEIVVDDEGISPSESIWGRSFKWDKLKNVTLFNKKIQVQYAGAGLKIEIAIPYLIRLGTDNIEKLDSALTKFCGKYGVGFTSEVEK